MSGLRGIKGQSDNRLHHTTCNGRIEDGIDVVLVFIQTTVEVDALRLTAIKRYGISKATFVEIVECRFHDDMYLYLLRLQLT